MSRLRDYFNDELFVRSHYGLTPTAKALKPGKELPMVLDRLEEIVDGEISFDPAQFSGKTTLAMNGFITSWLGPKLINLILREAPQIELNIVNWDSTTAESLINSEIQISVNYQPLETSKQLVQIKLRVDEFAVLCRKNHPILEEVATPNTIAQYPLASLIIHGWNESKAHITDVLSEVGAHPRVQFRSSYLDLIFDAVNNSDLLFPCSMRQAEASKGQHYRFISLRIYRVHWVELPV